jgi:hypothetical protein
MSSPQAPSTLNVYAPTEAVVKGAHVSFSIHFTLNESPILKPYDLRVRENFNTVSEFKPYSTHGEKTSEDAALS